MWLGLQSWLGQWDRTSCCIGFYMGMIAPLGEVVLFFHTTEVLHALVSGTESFTNLFRIISHLLCRPWTSAPYRNVDIWNSPLLRTQMRARLSQIMRKRNWTIGIVRVFSKITSTHTNIYFQETQRYTFCKTLHYFPALVISWSVLLIW